MIIKNVSSNQLEMALVRTNKVFDNNVIWNNFEILNRKANRFRVTLRVRNSHCLGARLGQHVSERTGNRRHLINACWHVHGVFFDFLPQGAEIRSGRFIIHPGDRWNDFDIGSMISPLMMSDACECYENEVKLPPKQYYS